MEDVKLVWDYRLKLFPQFSRFTLDLYQFFSLVYSNGGISRIFQLCEKELSIHREDIDAFIEYSYLFYLNFGVLKLRSFAKILPRITPADFYSIVRELSLEIPQLKEAFNLVKDEIFDLEKPSQLKYQVIYENETKLKVLIQNVTAAEPLYRVLDSYNILSTQIKGQHFEPLPLVIPVDVKLIEYYSNIANLQVAVNDNIPVSYAMTPLDLQNMMSNQILGTYQPAVFTRDTLRLTREIKNEDELCKLQSYYGLFRHALFVANQLLIALSPLSYPLVLPSSISNTPIGILAHRIIMSAPSSSGVTVADTEAVFNEGFIKTFLRKVPKCDQSLLAWSAANLEAYSQRLFDECLDVTWLLKSIKDNKASFAQEWLVECFVSLSKLAPHELVLECWLPLQTLPSGKFNYTPNLTEKVKILAWVSKLAYQHPAVFTHYAKQYGFGIIDTHTFVHKASGNVVYVFTMEWYKSRVVVPRFKDTPVFELDGIVISEAYDANSHLFDVVTNTMRLIVKDTEKKSFTTLVPPMDGVIYTGHSINAVFSNFLYYLYRKDKNELITFGQPYHFLSPLADFSSAKYLNEKQKRFLLTNDIIANYQSYPNFFNFQLVPPNQMMPTTDPYHHGIDNYINALAPIPDLGELGRLHNTNQAFFPKTVTPRTHFTNERFDNPNSFLQLFFKYNQRVTDIFVDQRDIHDLFKVGSNKFSELFSLAEGDPLTGKSALHCAIEANHLDLIRDILTRDIDIECRDINGRTPLFYAVINSVLPFVQLFLTRGANVHASDIDGQTPLMHAALHDNSEGQIVNFLLDHGANPLQVDRQGHNCFHFALQSGTLSIQKSLLRTISGREGYKVDSTAFYHAIMKSAPKKYHMDHVNFLFSLGAQITGPSPLTGCLAAIRSHKDILQKDIILLMNMLAEVGESLEYVGQDGTTLLIEAAKEDLHFVVEFLCQRLGGNRGYMNRVDSHGLSALDYAAKQPDAYKEQRTINLLMEFVDPILSSVMSSALAGHYSTPLAPLNLKQKGCTLKIRGKHDRSFLHNYYQKASDIDMLKKAIEWGVHPHALDDMRRSALHYAVMSCNGKEVTNLVQEPILMDINAPDIKYKTPIHYAAKRGDLVVLGALLTTRFNFDLSLKDHHGRTPLLVALRHGKFEAAKYLLSMGANLRDTDHNQMNSLHTAMRSASSFHFLEYLASVPQYDRVICELIQQKHIFGQNPLEYGLDGLDLLKEVLIGDWRKWITMKNVEIKTLIQPASYRYLSLIFSDQSYYWIDCAFNGGHSMNLSIALKYVSNWIELKKPFDALPSLYHKAVFQYLLADYKSASATVQAYLSTDPTLEGPYDLLPYHFLQTLIHVKLFNTSAIDRRTFLLAVRANLLPKYKHSILPEHKFEYKYLAALVCFELGYQKAAITILKFEKIIAYWHWEALYTYYQCLLVHEFYVGASIPFNKLVRCNQMNLLDQKSLRLSFSKDIQYFETSMTETGRQAVREKVDKIVETYTLDPTIVSPILNAYGFDLKTVERVKEPVFKLLVRHGEGSILQSIFAGGEIKSKSHEAFQRLNKIIEQIKKAYGRFTMPEFKIVQKLEEYYETFMQAVIDAKISNIDDTKCLISSLYTHDGVGGEVVNRFCQFGKVPSFDDENVNYIQMSRECNVDTSSIFTSLFKVFCGSVHTFAPTFIIHKTPDTTSVYSSVDSRGLLCGKPFIDSVTSVQSREFGALALTNLLITPGPIPTNHIILSYTATGSQTPILERSYADILYPSTRFGLRELTLAPGIPSHTYYNIMYHLPFIKDTIDSDIINQLSSTKFSVEEIIVKYLIGLQCTQSALEEVSQRRAVVEDLVSQGVRLSINLPAGFINDIYYALSSVAEYIKKSQTPVTYIDLFHYLYPNMKAFSSIYENPTVPNTISNINPLHQHSNATLDQETIDFISQIDFSKDIYDKSLLRYLQELNYVSALVLKNISSQQLYTILFKTQATHFANLRSIRLINPIDFDKISQLPHPVPSLLIL